MWTFYVCLHIYREATPLRGSEKGKESFHNNTIQPGLSLENGKKDNCTGRALGYVIDPRSLGQAEEAHCYRHDPCKRYGLYRNGWIQYTHYAQSLDGSIPVWLEYCDRSKAIGVVRNLHFLEQLLS